MASTSGEEGQGFDEALSAPISIRNSIRIIIDKTAARKLTEKKVRE